MAIEKELLIHWWIHYSKDIYTLAELEEFGKIIDEYGVEKVRDMAVISYVCGDGSPGLLLASIRRGVVREVFEHLSVLSNMDEGTKQQHGMMRKQFVNLIAQTL